jgi:hypothetical protein
MASRNKFTSGLLREVSWETVAKPLLSKRQPSWEDVESLIHSLNAGDPGSVYLKVANRNLLSISGNIEHGFLVTITGTSKQLYALAAPEMQGGTTILFVGLQRGEYPRRILVDRLTALTAARGFYLRGLADDGVNWTADAKSIR